MFRFVSVTVMLLLLAAFSGCVSRELTWTDHTDYLAREDHEIKKLKVVEVVSHADFFPVLSAMGRTVALVEKVPLPNDRAALSKIVTDLPSYRQLVGEEPFPFPVFLATRDAMEQHKSVWIVATHPLVVAIGVSHRESEFFFSVRPDENGRASLPKTLRLISEADLNETVTDLVVVESWQRTKNWDYKKVESKRIHLSQPRTLRQVMDSDHYPN